MVGWHASRARVGADRTAGDQSTRRLAARARQARPSRQPTGGRGSEDRQGTAPPDDAGTSPDQAAASDALGEIRQAIDALDRQIVGLLNERGRLAERVGATKAERGAP